MGASDTRRAGTYAWQRYRAGLRSYRRRMRPYVAFLVVASLLLVIVAALRWEIGAVPTFVLLSAGGLLALAVALREEPPDFVERWRRGAEGERNTEKALRPLVAEGWKVRHDHPFGGAGNVDHVLLSPSGFAYVIETKTLAGRVGLEHGVLTQRFADDPKPFRHDRLAGRLRMQVGCVASQWKRQSGKPAPPLRAVVVIWGAFAERCVEHDGVVYVVGSDLEEALRRLDATAT